MEKIADLHIHTVFSDGVYTPRKMLEKAEHIGLRAISICDHDSVDGYLDAQKHLKDFNVELIPGLELSSHQYSKEYHILGYNFDVFNEALNKHLKNFKNQRYIRAEKILFKLSKRNIRLDLDYILSIAGQAPIARPHIATALLNFGYVQSFKEAFLLYLGEGRPAYEAKTTFPTEEAVKLINGAGGVAVLAHPARTITQNTLYEMIEFGLDGIEVIHPMHDPALQSFYHEIAGQYWLVETGGSDYHGNRDYDEINFGKFYVPFSVVDSIKFHSIKR